MSNPEEMDSCVPDTQETCKNSNEDSERKIFNENQHASWNESQDFHLIVEDESMTEKTKLSMEAEDANHQDSAGQSNLQQIPDTSQTDDKVVATNDKEVKNIGDEKVMESESVGNVFSDVNDSEKKDELSDEDEIIQATPPQNHSPSRKAVSNIDATNLKRRAEPIDELPSKIARTVSMEDIVDSEKRLENEEEESRQSDESDDSYQDLFKNIDKHVVIEETQDPTNQEFTQNSLSSPFECTTTNDDKAQAPHQSEQANQQEEVFSEKRCSMEKDENLNVSAKLTDVSANDSIVVNVNSINESDSQVEDKGMEDLPIEANRNVDSTAAEKFVVETLDETDKSVEVKDTEIIFDEDNKIEHANCIEKTDNNDEKTSSSQIKLRTSIEVIYEEGANQTANNDENKSKEVVEIDEDEGDKIVDSSTEVIYDGKKNKPEPEVVEIVDDSRDDSERTRPGRILNSGEGSEIQSVEKSSIDFSYKSTESVKESWDSRPLTSDDRMVNGSLESKKTDNDGTLSMESDAFSGCDGSIFTKPDNVDNVKKQDNVKSNSFVFRDPDNIELINISDNDTPNAEEKKKSDPIHNTASTKTVQVEREIGMYVKLKCVIHMDENTKEHVNKELTAVNCEPVIIESTSRQKNEDSQSSLADISDNKDSPPCSVNSNPQLYQLNPSRLSIMSSISSSSSASSAAALAAKIALKAHYPMGPMRYAKKSSHESLLTDKLVLDEIYDRVTREWKNHHLMTATILSYANTELGATNISNIELDHRNPHLRDNFVRSSTPEETAVIDAKLELTTTPKNTKKGKAVKRQRGKVTRSNVMQTNGNEDMVNINTEPTLHASFVTETDTPSRKKSRLESTENKLDTDGLANSSLQNDPADELVGKSVFAKWSDKNYYPGVVSDRLKTKYKVNFYDGKSKTLIPEFVIPIPKILREGLSVYATTKTNDYGSCGIIIDSHTSTSTINKGEDNSDTYYTVETDDGERLRVQVRDIFLSNDQAQVLKEEVESLDKGSLPSTPKALGQVTLDNLVDGKRRSKRIGTPVFSTPKSRDSGISSSTSKTRSSKPSVSGMSRLKDTSENEGMSSDSNVGSAQVEDEYVLRGVQREIIGTPCEQIVKGPQNRIKGKSRNKKKIEDPQIIATLGPIPPANSTIFKDKSFILTCVDVKMCERFKEPASSIEIEVSDTEVETENEEEWNERPFVRDRLHAQILAGGGKIYENFDQIPREEYKNTTLITNVPNTTAKSVLCLSVGIPMCNHRWIIRCCSEGKRVTQGEEELPTGWSLQKKKYVERFEAKDKPLSETIVIIPNLVSDSWFVTFWRQVCDNAGAVVIIVDDLGAMETMDFASRNKIVLSNRKCPSWAVNRANQLQIPIVSTTWVIQCLIEGKTCQHDQHPRYKYNYILH